MSQFAISVFAILNNIVEMQWRIQRIKRIQIQLTRIPFSGDWDINTAMKKNQKTVKNNQKNQQIYTERSKKSGNIPNESCLLDYET